MLADGDSSVWAFRRGLRESMAVRLCRRERTWGFVIEGGRGVMTSTVCEVLRKAGTMLVCSLVWRGEGSYKP